MVLPEGLTGVFRWSGKDVLLALGVNELRMVE